MILDKLNRIHDNVVTSFERDYPRRAGLIKAAIQQHLEAAAAAHQKHVTFCLEDLVFSERRDLCLGYIRAYCSSLRAEGLTYSEESFWDGDRRGTLSWRTPS